jgi:hypothetical protein
MNAAVAYYFAGLGLSTPGSPDPRRPGGSGEPRRRLIALLAAVAVVLASALGAIAF